MQKRVMFVLSLSLALAGCQQQPEQAAPQAQAEPTGSTAANQIEEAKAIATARSQARGPAVTRAQPADAAGQDPAPDADAAAQPPAAPQQPTAAEPTPEDLPPIVPFLKMNAHMTGVFGIMELHKDDCEKAAAEVEAYAAKHRPEMVALSKELNALANKLSEEDQARFRAWSMKAGQQMLNKSMGVMMLFHQKCPEHMQRINAQVRTLSSPPDPPAK